MLRPWQQQFLENAALVAIFAGPVAGTVGALACARPSETLWLCRNGKRSFAIVRDSESIRAVIARRVLVPHLKRAAGSRLIFDRKN